MSSSLREVRNDIYKPNQFLITNLSPLHCSRKFNLANIIPLANTNYKQETVLPSTLSLVSTSLSDHMIWFTNVLINTSFSSHRLSQDSPAARHIFLLDIFPFLKVLTQNRACPTHIFPSRRPPRLAHSAKAPSNIESSLHCLPWIAALVSTEPWQGGWGFIHMPSSSSWLQSLSRCPLYADGIVLHVGTDRVIW